MSRLYLKANLAVQNLVDNLLAKWNSLSVAEQPPHLGERLEELFLEASMLEAVSTPLPMSGSKVMCYLL